MSEKNILNFIKEMGLSHAEVIEILTEKADKDKALLTQEEKAEAEAKAKLEVKEKAEKAKTKAEEEKDKTPPKEEPDASIEKQLKAIQDKLDELEKSGKVPGKDPSEGKTLEKGALPESTVFTVQKNMFEVDV